MLGKSASFVREKNQKCKMGVKWVGSGRVTSILCQDDQLGTPEVLGQILANKCKNMEKTRSSEIVPPGFGVFS